MPSEAAKYWFYSRECVRQAGQAETEERRSRLLELSAHGARRRSARKHMASARHLPRCTKRSEAVADILRFPRLINGSLDADTTSLLGGVFDAAMSSVESRQPDIVREAVASRIITLALRGERDPDRLRAAALHGLGLPRYPDQVLPTK